MKTILVCLVGGQPVPNLLPIKHWQPDQVTLIYSETTELVSDRLVKVLENYKMDVSSLKSDRGSVVNIKGQSKPDGQLRSRL